MSTSYIKRRIGRFHAVVETHYYHHLNRVNVYNEPMIVTVKEIDSV